MHTICHGYCNIEIERFEVEYWVPIFYYKSVSIRLRGRPRGLTPRRKEDVSTIIRTAPRSGRVRTTVCAFFSRKHAHATKENRCQYYNVITRLGSWTIPAAVYARTTPVRGYYCDVCIRQRAVDTRRRTRQNNACYRNRN